MLKPRSVQGYCRRRAKAVLKKQKQLGALQHAHSDQPQPLEATDKLAAFLKIARSIPSIIHADETDNTERLFKAMQVLGAAELLRRPPQNRMSQLLRSIADAQHLWSFNASTDARMKLEEAYGVISEHLHNGSISPLVLISQLFFSDQWYSCKPLLAIAQAFTDSVATRNLGRNHPFTVALQSMCKLSAGARHYITIIDCMIDPPPFSRVKGGPKLLRGLTVDRIKHCGRM